MDASGRLVFRAKIEASPQGDNGAEIGRKKAQKRSRGRVVDVDTFDQDAESVGTRLAIASFFSPSHDYRHRHRAAATKNEMFCQVPQRWRKSMLLCVGAVFLLGGVVAVSLAASDLERFRGASRARCYIQGFGGRESYEATKCLQDGPPCKFVVAVENAEFGMFLVQSWEPVFGKSYYGDARIRPVDDEFRCCPMDGPFTCCQFFDANISQFCDNWVGLDPSCPSTPWFCYVFNLHEFLDTHEVPSEELHVGDIFRSIPLLITGSVFILGGAIWLACMTPYIRKRRRKAYFLLISVLPAHLRTQRMVQLFTAAVAIQRAIRGWLIRLRLQKLVRKIWAERGPWVFDEPLREAAKRQCAELSRPIIGPPPIGVKSRALLLDTGDVNTFRRLARACAKFVPGNASEYIELALSHNSLEDIGLTMALKDASMGQFASVENGMPVVYQVKQAGLAAAYGLREGCVLLKAGRLEWPNATGKQLLATIRGSQRPLFLVFQGFIQAQPPPANLLNPPLPPASPPPPLDLQPPRDDTRSRHPTDRKSVV